MLLFMWLEMDQLCLVQSGIDLLFARILARLTGPEPPFDLSRLNYQTRCRFVQLLSKETCYQFSLTSKANYLKCLQEQGRFIDVTKWGSGSSLGESNGNLTFYFDTTASYAQFEAKYARFLPYFRIHFLHVYFAFAHKDERNHNGEVLPVPKTFPWLRVSGLERLEDVDHLADNYGHEDLRHTSISFRGVTGVEGYVQLVHQLFQKFPQVKAFNLRLNLDGALIDQFTSSLQIPESVYTLYITFESKEPPRFYFSGRWCDHTQTFEVKRFLKTLCEQAREYYEPLLMAALLSLFVHQMIRQRILVSSIM